MLMKRSPCINPLFALVSSVNRLYISNGEVFSISSVEVPRMVIRITTLLTENTSSLLIYKRFTLDTRANRGLTHRHLFINMPSQIIQTHLNYLWKPEDGHCMPKRVVSFIRI